MPAADAAASGCPAPARPPTPRRLHRLPGRTTDDPPAPAWPPASRRDSPSTSAGRCWIVRAAFIVTSLAARRRAAALPLALGVDAVVAGRRASEPAAHRSPGSSSCASAVSLLVWRGRGAGPCTTTRSARCSVVTDVRGIALGRRGRSVGDVHRPAELDPGPRHELTIRIAATALLAVTALVFVVGARRSLIPGRPTFVTALAAVRRHRARLRADAHRPVARPHGRAHAAHPRRGAQRDRRAPARLGAADPRPHREPCGATSESRRIARAQERELRDWLFAGDAPPQRPCHCPCATRRSARIDYAVTFDVVAVGESRERRQRRARGCSARGHAERGEARRGRGVGVRRVEPRSGRGVRARPRTGVRARARCRATGSACASRSSAACAVLAGRARFGPARAASASSCGCTPRRAHRIGERPWLRHPIDSSGPRSCVSSWSTTT